MLFMNRQFIFLHNLDARYKREENLESDSWEGLHTRSMRNDCLEESQNK